MKCIRSFVFFVFAVFSLSGMAREPEPLRVIENANLIRADGKPITLSKMHDAILLAANGQGWEILKDDAPGVVVLKYAYKKRIRVVVTVNFTGNSYSIAHRDSVELFYSDNSGSPVIHPRYYEFVDPLNDSIRRGVVEN